MRAKAIVVVATLWLSACSVGIQHGLDEAEANQIIVVLDRAGIPASKEREEGRRPTWKVRVAGSEATRAWQVLREHELPRGRAPGFDLFQKGGLIPTQTEERALYQQALSGEITKMLLAYPGVVDARVLVSLPRERAFGAGGPAPKPTASVLLKQVADAQSVFKTADIQGLVAGAVPGLEPGQVTVVAAPVRPAEAPESTMARLGPFVVSRDSQSGLQIALIAGGLVVFVLGAAVVWGGLQLRRARSRLREAQASRETAE
jgi:type III secretion system YscJ/HrcJ family lipoprotein